MVDAVSVRRHVRRAVLWLSRSQRRVGIWKEPTLPLTVATTSQAALAFLSVGFPSSYIGLRRALNWLFRSQVTEEVEHSFWRLLPSARAEERPRGDWDGDLRRLVKIISGGVRLARDLSYRAYLMECIVALGYPTDPYSKEVDALRRDVRESSATPLEALWGYVALELAVGPPGEDSATMVLDKVQRSLTTDNEWCHLGGSVASTAYTVLDLCRSPSLSKRPDARAMIDACVPWILARCRRSGHWAGEKPIGMSRTLVTAVAVRALAAYLDSRGIPYHGHLLTPDYETMRRLERLGPPLVGTSLLTFCSALLWTAGVIDDALAVVGSATSILGVWLAVRQRRV